MKITNEDNMLLMARYEDNYFDLAIVDPPYGIDINESIGRRKGMKHSGHKKAVWDNEIPTNEYFKELKRVSKNQIIWGANYFNMPPTKCFIIWDKNYSEDVTFSRYEYAWASFNKTSKGFEFNGQANKNKIHPTQKPVKLYEWLLMNYAQRKCSHKHRESERYLCTDCRNSDVKILDTHLGSGSIALACHNLGFDLTACELDKEYYNAAMKRLKQHQQQLTMF
jgi:site-specific DNA-methyltransferase (adenine-specific)